MKYAINAPTVPDAPGRASQGTTAGRFIFISGQLPLDVDSTASAVAPFTHPDGSALTQPALVSEDVGVQVEREILYVEACLSTVECTLEDVAQVTLYLTNLNLLPEVDAVWERYFTQPAPARSVVAVSELLYGAQVQIDCVACR